MRRLNDTICIQNGYSIVENPKPKGKSYDNWLGDMKNLSHRDRICLTIDNALAQKPESFDALLALLRDYGYQVKDGKVPSLFGGDQKRFLRMDTLGKGYTPEDLRAVLAGEKEHTPKKYRAKKATPEKKSGSLLIDIQKAIQEGKSGKYLDFINRYNLKQIAQSVAYLEERGMLDRELLAQNAAAASDRFHGLSEQIKAAETRMKEIAVLREHIRNYIKTRDTYVAYRKAGYSKKFLAEHESDIALHKAAKKKFDELGVKKLPTLKSLDAEYARLLAEKKALFPEYRKAREEMKELLTAKSNFDRLLGLEEERAEPNATKEKGTEQR